MTESANKSAQWAAVIAVTGGCAVITALFFEMRPYYPALIAAGVFVVLGLLVSSGSKTPSKTSYFPLLIPAALLVLVWVAMTLLFGDFEFTAILYHLKFGFASGGLTGGQKGLIAILCLGFVLTVYGWTRLGNLNNRIRLADRVLCLPLLALNPATLEMVHSYRAANHHGIALLDEYVSPSVAPEADRPQPDFIRIYMESHELTFAQHPEFGETMAPLEPFGKRGLFATDINQVEATTWTVAGQIASQCGIPALFELQRDRAESDRQFLPGARCLGDVLEGDGYSIAYLGGARLEFGSKGNFLASHGFGELAGARKLSRQYQENMNFWGVDDEAVLDAAYDRIVQTAQNGQPDSTVIMTLSGHSPDGIISLPCRDGRIEVMGEDPTLRAIHCTNMLIARLLDRLDNEGLLENTIVVLQSDHLSRKTSVDRQLRKRDRNNYFAAFGPGIEARTITRPATMMDVYPTVLELLGYDLAQGRAGLGVSLLSENQNLLERFGEEELNLSIKGDMELRRAMWLRQGNS
jgi:phosphoglycerol transferase